jgi:microcin C transport system permease protein
MRFGWSIDPLTRRRWQRFRSIRRAWVALWLLVGLYGVSLGADLLANDRPLAVRYDGSWYFPLLRFHPEDRFLGNGSAARPDYRQLAASPRFAPETGNRMIWPPLRYGPQESVPRQAIALPREIQIRVRPSPQVGNVNLTPEGLITRPQAAGFFFGRADEAVEGLRLTEFFPLPPAFSEALRLRFANQPAPEVELRLPGPAEVPVLASLTPFAPRAQPPRTVRVTLRTGEDERRPAALLRLTEAGEIEPGPWASWRATTPEQRAQISAWAAARHVAPQPEQTLEVEGRRYALSFDKEEVLFPLRPIPGHPFGFDGAGRDVGVRMLHACRIALSFGLLLTAASIVLGVLLGAIQGFFGGWVDLAGQRFTEIWSSLPFLYVVILLGSVYGRGFALLLGVYTAFNWIGMASYMRGEFLRLRKQPFVESALCLGGSRRRLMFRHILPNALTPVVTLFPFLLVGAIGSINALDYLGFGMPAGTPSWGELLGQAQEYRYAWWLTLYPALALFIVMLLGVFVGDGVRAAFDPRAESRLQ